MRFQFQPSLHVLSDCLLCTASCSYSTKPKILMEFKLKMHTIRSAFMQMMDYFSFRIHKPVSLRPVSLSKTFSCITDYTINKTMVLAINCDFQSVSIT